MFSTATSSPLQGLLDLANHLFFHMICPALMTDTDCLNACQKLQPDEFILLHPN
jgi:hypothetical protein